METHVKRLVAQVSRCTKIKDGNMNCLHLFIDLLPKPHKTLEKFNEEYSSV